LFWTLSIVLYVEDKKSHNVSETESVSVFRWMGQDKPTQLGPLERASPVIETRIVLVQKNLLYNLRNFFVVLCGYLHLSSLSFCTHTHTHTRVVFVTFRTRFVNMVTMKLCHVFKVPILDLWWNIRGKKQTSNLTHACNRNIYSFFESSFLKRKVMEFILTHYYYYQFLRCLCVCVFILPFNF
jgi:hypothetical protein